MSKTERKRILFVAEAVTLAHITRPLVLAKALDPRLFDLHFACAPGSESLLDSAPIQPWSIRTISSERFLKALLSGSPIYDRHTLEEYVEEDTRLLRAVQPDLVVGDFRLSLAISAPLYRVPYVAVANAYWSPFSTLERYPVPDLKITRLLGIGLTSAIFHLSRSFIFAYHARPLNQVRQKYGLPKLRGLLEVYTHGDYVLYTDIPDLFRTTPLPANHLYVGPISWSPNIELPSWWTDLDDQRPIVYLNLGSSGPVHVIPTLLEALAVLPVTVVLATAGRWNSRAIPSNVRQGDFLPGDRVVARSKVVICNGGSPSVYQALRPGVPVLGVPSNMDQHLMMQAIVKEGAGILIRCEQATVEDIRNAVTQLLENESYRLSASRLQKAVAEYNAEERFVALVDDVLFKRARNN